MTEEIPSASTDPDPEAAGESSPESDDDQPEHANLVGKINNLMSIDLENVVGGRNILFLLWVPLQIVITVVFLYQLLGWR